jgi:hypothetical protein
MSTTRSGALTGLALLSALALCAFAAPSAAQAGTGTTAVTCVAEAEGPFIDNHCSELAANPKTEGHFKHATIANGTKTKTHFQSTLASITFSGTIALLKVKVTCTGMTGTGFLENSEPTPGNHTVSGSEIDLTYTGCDLMLGKTEITCSLVGAEIVFSELKAMDVENAHGFAMGIKFEPKKAGVFGVFTTGPDCPNIPNQKFEFTGSMLGVPHGATLEFTEASTKPTLTLAGNAASLVDTDTIRMLNEFNEPENPISFTTTP